MRWRAKCSGEGKAVAGAARDRLAEILHNYQHDLPAFALYARTDARLAYQIVEKLDLVELAFARSQLTGMTPDRVAASIASFDFLYLTELERAHIVAPERAGRRLARARRAAGRPRARARHGSAPQRLGVRFQEPVPQHHPHLQYRSRELRADADAGSRSHPHAEGAFRREPAILPRLLDELFPRREAAKRRGDDVAAHAIKILMNSFYGVLGTPACRFFNPALANSITGMGKQLLLWSKHWFEAAGFRVLYGDTDSLFVRSATSRPGGGERRGARLAARAQSRPRAAHRGALARAEPPRARVREAVSEAVPAARPAQHARREQALCRAGARRRRPGTVEFVGMEVVRRDWTALAKRVQRELYQRLFTDQPVDAYLAEIVASVRRGELDEELVYHKNLRKEHGRVHRHDAAARRRRAQVAQGARQIDPLRHDHGRRRAARQPIRIRSIASTMWRNRSSRSRSRCWIRWDWTSSA